MDQALLSNMRVSPPTVRRKGLLRRIWDYRDIYLFISPFYILFFVFGLFPILFGAYLSFHEWTGFDTMRWIGAQNYQSLFNDELFWTGLKNTVYMWIVKIVPLLGFSFLMAILLNSPLRFRGAYRTMIYLPNVTATVAMGLVFGLVLDTNYGILNLVLSKIGMPAIPWTSSTQWSKPTIVIFSIWGALGWYMVLFLAGLQSINPQLYEAARVDGANALERLIYITVPAMRGILFFCFVTETIWSMRSFTEPFVLTSGGPLDSSLTISMYLYETAFQFFKMGYAAAMSFVLFGMTLLVSLFQGLGWGRRTVFGGD